MDVLLNPRSKDPLKAGHILLRKNPLRYLPAWEDTQSLIREDTAVPRTPQVPYVSIHSLNAGFPGEIRFLTAYSLHLFQKNGRGTSLGPKTTAC